MDQGIRLHLDFNVGYLLDFDSDRSMPSRSFPALRIFIDQHSSDTDALPDENKEDIPPMAAARHDFNREKQGNS
jgi:hypothetical protein